MYETQMELLRELLNRRADPSTRDWWERYVKNSAPFLGVKMADIRSATHEWYSRGVAHELDEAQQVDLGLALFFQEYAEEKVAGILLLQEILLPTGAVTCGQQIDRFAALFAPGGIYDWNVCDWFCVKVLGPLIERDGESCARRIAGWRTAPDLWQARAALVAFVPVAADRSHYPLIEKGCRALIQREERFAKTAVGWILREISRHEPAFVRQVLEELLPYFSIESLRNATKYFDRQEQKNYRQRLKKA